MGDGGSLVLGLLMGLLTIRATYLPSGANSGQPHAVLTPLVLLAVPLYDLVSVVCLRLRQGRSPFVGDLSHFSHRLVRRGLSRRAAVVVICGCTAVTALGGVALPTLEAWQALLVGGQTLLVVLVLAVVEARAAPPPDPT
jgi:UDP-GlcNAc:undecaprenyl-phosphate GlcNAc-1-phosphate transferase